MLIINSRGKIENEDSLTREIREYLARMTNIFIGYLLDEIAKTNYNIARRDSQTDEQLRGEITSIYK